MQFAIRAATAQDCDALLPVFDEVDALHREHVPHVFQDPHGPAREREYLLGVLADESCGLYVAQAGDEILGLVQVVIRDAPPIPIVVPRRVAVVETLAVKQGFRRAGIGRALMRQVQCWAEDRGAHEIELMVYEFNRDAISFYHNLGYSTSSRRMGKRLG